MNIKMLDKGENEISFLINGISPYLANTLRRTIVEDVPTLAIEDVEFRDNSSLLYDEMVAHRLGLLLIQFAIVFHEIPFLYSKIFLRKLWV